MAQQPNIKRNLEAGQIYIAFWVNGVHVNRSPLFTPISALGNQIISHFDTLWGGSNMELSMQNTLVRRPGYPQWCSVAFNAGEWPLQFCGYKNFTGAITPLVDTQTNVYAFTPTSKTNLVTKPSGAVQTAFQRIGQALYMANFKTFQATGDTGTVSAAALRPVGLAVPAISPTFTVGGNGFLVPTTGFTYGYSYASSVNGHVSTMSPISGDVGDLNVAVVTESYVQYPVTNYSGSGTSVVFGTPNGNNLWIGARVTISGINMTWVPSGYSWVITAVTSASFTIAFAATFSSTPLIGVTATLNPITIPGAAAANPYVYTVDQAANFAPTNAFGASGNIMSIVGQGGSPAYSQISGGTPSTGQYVVNAATGQITFALADAGKALGAIKYAITPLTGGAPVSFVVSGPSSNNPAFPGGNQTDVTGYVIVDSIVVYRDQDSGLAAGPWYYLAIIPNNLALVSATLQSGQTVYAFANPCPAGANNGFAGAPNSGGATISGFVNGGNNGRFDIVASTTTTIICTNSSGVNETHAAIVNSQSWSYTDTGAVFGYTFNATVPDGELDTLIVAPISASNNPPPNTTNPLTTSVTGTFSLLCFGAGRLWGAVNNYVYFAGGPDVTLGNGAEAWPPANVFTFPGVVKALVSVPAGIVVFTSDEMWMIYGTSTSTFYSALYQKNLGVLSPNCVVLDGNTLYVYSNQGQLWSFTSEQLEIGLNVAPLITATFNPASTYLAMHKNGYDVGLFISDGQTNYMRYRIDTGSWSPMCQIVGGASCFQSIETSTGVYTLLVGSASGAGYITGRSLTTWADAGGTYPCYAIVGSLTVAPPGATALIDFITLQYVPTGTAPAVAILPQDFATLLGVGNFTSLGAGFNDPPKLLPTKSQNIKQNRWYLKRAQTPLAQEMCNLQVKISFPAENFKAEIHTMGVT